MANPAGAKGYRGEQPVIDYLKKRGFRWAYRLRSQGVNDKGDVGNIENVVIEIKNQAIYKISEWMRETKVEKGRAKAETAALVVKPKGHGDGRIADWWTILTLEDYVSLLIKAGYGPNEVELLNDDEYAGRSHP
jgi:hypothetical protein